MRSLPNYLAVVAIFMQFSLPSLFQEFDKKEAFCETVDGKRGVCVNILQKIKFCPTLFSLLRNRSFEELRKSVCSEDNRRVCCPISGFNEVIQQNPEPDYSKHPNFRLFPIKNCGQTLNSDRIIGGNRSLPGEHPFVVRLGFKFDADPSNEIRYICGGSLINRRYVLTAQHCFQAGRNTLVEVVLGQSDEELEEECIEQFDLCSEPVRAGIEEIILYPGYKRSSEHDIALIRLDRDIDVTSLFTIPICLPFLKEYYVDHKLEDATITNLDAQVAGWGKLNNDEAIGSQTLQSVRVPIQPHILCRITFNRLNVTNSQLCVGGNKGKGSCQGDSGGPLYALANPLRGSRNPRMFQLGIVAYGNRICAKKNVPVVYTRVRNYLEWILDNVRE